MASHFIKGFEKVAISLGLAGRAAFERMARSAPFAKKQIQAAGTAVKKALPEKTLKTNWRKANKGRDVPEEMRYAPTAARKAYNNAAIKLRDKLHTVPGATERINNPPVKKKLPMRIELDLGAPSQASKAVETPKAKLPPAPSREMTH